MTNNDTNNWPLRLKAWRAGRNISMEAAARKLGVSLSAWQKWEGAKATPSGLAQAALEILLRDAGQR